ncbi:MAG: PDDEXK family nuclease [Planctomycetota bacterium]|jgi:hypothetical protein
MNAHIINCDESEFVDSFLPGGYLGVSIAIKSATPQGLSKACRTAYSMYADMKTIRVGDIVFVHAGQRIYGAFKAETEFSEDSDVPEHFLSTNIHYQPDPAIPGSGWKDKITQPASLGYYRRIGISHFEGADGANLCYEAGVDSNEIFELKSKGKLWSTPERWKYGDASRTVRPLMENEAFELLKILDRENADSKSRRTVESANLESYLPIRFVLNPATITNEKIIEGWVLENIGRHNLLDEALGPLTSFGNNMPAGYLKFMDIFGYQELASGVKKYKVIEVKKDECVFPDNINQVLGYSDWVVRNLAGGDYRLVESIVIANGFTDESIKFAENSNTLSRRMRLIRFDYDSPGYETLLISRVV